MIAAFASYALPVLFIASGLFAAAVLAMTWRTYGREIAALRAMLNTVDDTRQFTICVATVETRGFTPAPRRGSVRRAAAVRSLRQPALRVAA